MVDTVRYNNDVARNSRGSRVLHYLFVLSVRLIFNRDFTPYEPARWGEMPRYHEKNAPVQSNAPFPL